MAQFERDAVVREYNAQGGLAEGATRRLPQQAADDAALIRAKGSAS